MRLPILSVAGLFTFVNRFFGYLKTTQINLFEWLSRDLATFVGVASDTNGVLSSA